MKTIILSCGGLFAEIPPPLGGQTNKRREKLEQGGEAQRAELRKQKQTHGPTLAARDNNAEKTADVRKQGDEADVVAQQVEIQKQAFPLGFARYTHEKKMIPKGIPGVFLPLALPLLLWIAVLPGVTVVDTPVCKEKHGVRRHKEGRDQQE